MMLDSRRSSLGLLVMLCIATGWAARGAEEQPTPAAAEEPRELGLIERAERGLAQLDVTVQGPADAIAELTPEDFELVIQGRAIEELIVDRICARPATEGSGPESGKTVEAGVEAAETPASVPATYLFYFDQPHLTSEGRINALENARRMIPELVRDGGRAAIISTADDMETVVDLTDDVDSLLAGLDRLEGDRTQWDIYPQQEEQRIRDVMENLQKNSLESACGAARRYQLEESFRTDRALRKLSIILGLLADMDPPKAVVYFADTMRSTAGAHYYSYIGRCGQSGTAENRELSSFGSQHALDRVIDQATANGIRVYTVQAQGLVAGSSSIVPGANARASAGINSQRIREAQDSLAGLAVETGGQPFLNGVSATKMTRAIQEDLECLYLISFDPGDLPLDAPLRVVLRSKLPDVKARTRGRFVLQSESTRRTARLLSAFATPGSVRTDLPLRGVLVPTGYRDGRYTALVQIAVPPSPLSAAEWDLGVSLISRGEFKEDASGRVEVREPRIPVVFETEMSFKPGPFELIFVAHDNVADQLATVTVDGSWPERDDGPSIGPVAVLQPVGGLFVRDGETRAGGPLGRDDRDPPSAELPTALIGLICRAPGRKARSLRVERSLIGEGVTQFDPLTMTIGDERCAQIRDLIPASTMTAGAFRYEIRVYDEKREAARSSHEFSVIESRAGTR